VPFISALTLLVLGVSRANDANHALALDHLAVLADRLDAASYFHKSSYGRAKSSRVTPGGNSELAFENTEGRKRSQLNELPFFTGFQSEGNRDCGLRTNGIDDRRLIED
jgi:hypothetical protein